MKFCAFVLVLLNCGTWAYEDVGSKVGIVGIKGIVAAFGDFNGDKHTDLFVVAGSKGASLEVYLWSSSDQKFTKGRARVDVGDNNSIVNVGPADFDGDGCMDVLVTTVPAGQDECSKLHTAQVFWGHQQYFEKNSTLVSDQLMDQLLIIDANGDLLPDLFGAAYPSLSNRTYWISSGRGFTAQSQAANPQMASLRTPHSNAFLDLTGDATADLFITTMSNNKSKQYEVWKNQDGVLKRSEPQGLPYDISKTAKHIGQSAFADLDGDGLLDHLLPVCMTGNCSESHIYVYGKGKWSKILSNGQWQFRAPSSDCPTIPSLTIRIGDFNMDGYPDALLIADMKSGNEYYAGVPLLLQNVACNNPEGPDCFAGRTFYIRWEGFKSLTNAVVATFFDLYEDGLSDFLVVTRSSDGSQRIHAMKNDFVGDTYFLKVIVLGGRCLDSCSSGVLPFGVNQAGPFVEYVTTDTSGKQKRGSAAQLSQSSYYALQCPYTLFGLGPTPNFVDKVTVGMPRSQGAPLRRREWPSIIPNSQVIVIPYPPDEPSSWQTILVLTPSKLVLITGVALLGICLVIALIILLLHLKEKREDQKEKRQDAHKFHFDAM